MASALLTLFTFVTSVVFITSLRDKNYTIAYMVSIFFMVVPTVLNLVVVCYLIQRQRGSQVVAPACVEKKLHDDELKRCKKPEEVNEQPKDWMTFDTWLDKGLNSLTFTIMLVSLISIDCLALLTSSQVLNLYALSAPWPELAAMYSSGHPWCVVQECSTIVHPDLRHSARAPMDIAAGAVGVRISGGCVVWTVRALDQLPVVAVSRAVVGVIGRQAGAHIASGTHPAQLGAGRTSTFALQLLLRQEVATSRRPN